MTHCVSRVAAVWLRLGEMSDYADLGDAFFMPHLPTRKPVDHTRSVTLSAIGIAQALAETQQISCDMDRLIAASLLHDASKCVEFERRADGTYGRTARTRQELSALVHRHGDCQAGGHPGRRGAPDRRALTHRAAVTRYVEGAVLHHADMVDSNCVNFVASMLTDRVKKGRPACLHQDIFDRRRLRAGPCPAPRAV